MKQTYAPATWEIFPVAQLVAHDKAAMIHHDLGQFVTNRQVLAWTLGLGFSMSYRVHATALEHDAPREWLRWLDRVQKSICARYVGQPLRDFGHDRGVHPTVEDDGVIRAQYGPVRLLANLNARPCREADRQLAPYGFWATAPGLVAANLKSLGGIDFRDTGISFAAEGEGRKGNLWVYAPAGQEVAVLLASKAIHPVTLAFDDGTRVQTSVAGGAHAFRLPSRPEQRPVPARPIVPGEKYLWHAVVAPG